MLAVILTILKIIGIILLIILGIIMLVLLFPFSYRIDVKIAGKSLEGHLKAWWLFRFVSFNLIFVDSKLEYALRVIGIKTPINSDDDKDDKRKDRDVKDSGYKENGYSSETINDNKEDNIENIENIEVTKDKEKVEDKDNKAKINWDEVLKDIDDTDEELNIEDKNFDSNKDFENSKDSINADENTADNESDSSKDDIFHKIAKVIKNINNKIKSIYKKIRKLWIDFIDKKNYISRKYKRIKYFLAKEESKAAYQRGKKHLFSLIKHILPNKITVDGDVGFDSPDKTGKLLGILGMLFGIFNINGKNVNIRPDFENEVINFSCNAKGYIILIVVLYYATRLYFNRIVRFLKREFL